MEGQEVAQDAPQGTQDAPPPVSEPGRFTCPRREEIPCVFKFSEEKDADTWGTDGTCSFCGSMNPETVLAHIRAGTATFDPTDKNYKLYVKPKGAREGKFYFQHFDRAQKLEFVDLYNAGRITLNHPGYFYVMPFFMCLIQSNALDSQPGAISQGGAPGAAG